MSINIEKIIYSDFVNNLISQEWYIRLSGLLENLSKIQLTLILFVAMVLLAFMVYRKLGPISMTALVFFYIIIYALYQFDILSVYEVREKNQAEYMQQLQEELNKF